MKFGFLSLKNHNYAFTQSIGAEKQDFRHFKSVLPR